jgi:HAE1 family hydrophobic/amphiphilic exporter-1
MTTTSIVAGLIPMALAFGSGGTQRAAIAVTIIGGQSLCLLLTLLVTPVAYSLFAGMERKLAFAPLTAGLARLYLGMARVFTLHMR